MKDPYMKTRIWIILTSLAVMLSGCIPSVNPFYTEKDLVFEPRLVGEWQEKDTTGQPEVWKFAKEGANHYKLLITDKEGKQGEFEAHLFRLKQEQFLDLKPSECHFATNQADLVAICMIPGHLLVRVSQFEPDLKLAFIDSDWLEKYLTNNPSALAYHREDKSGILTAQTADLQRFVLQHLGDGELFAKPGELVRKTKDVHGN